MLRGFIIWRLNIIRINWLGFKSPNQLNKRKEVAYMLYMDMIKASIKQGKQESSKLYFCGNDKSYKIGQTAQKYVCQRMQTIKKTEPNTVLYCYVEFLGSKALREYVESSVRLYMQGKGYQLQGNDHFAKRGKRATFKCHFLDIVTATLNALDINYTVVNK